MKLFDRLEDGKEAEHVVWIGYDPLEDALAKMMAHSIRSRTKKKDLKIIPIIKDELLAFDICNRPRDPEGTTQFSITRFLVPYLMNYTGVGIFVRQTPYLIKSTAKLKRPSPLKSFGFY